MQLTGEVTEVFVLPHPFVVVAVISTLVPTGIPLITVAVTVPAEEVTTPLLE